MAPLFHSLSTRYKWVVPASWLPYQLNRKLGEPWSSYTCCGEEKSLACAGYGLHVSTGTPSDGFGHECWGNWGHRKHLRAVGSSNMADARICEVGTTLKRPPRWRNRSNEGRALNTLKSPLFSFLKSLYSHKKRWRCECLTCVCTLRAPHAVRCMLF